MNHEKSAKSGNHEENAAVELPVVTPQSATSDIAAAAALAISKARSVVGQGWRKLVSDLGTIP